MATEQGCRQGRTAPPEGLARRLADREAARQRHHREMAGKILAAEAVRRAG